MKITGLIRSALGRQGISDGRCPCCGEQINNIALDFNELDEFKEKGLFV